MMFYYLGLPTLELRRLHIDLNWCFIVFKHVRLNFDDFLNLVMRLLHVPGHAYKLQKYDVFVVTALPTVLIFV